MRPEFWKQRWEAGQLGFHREDVNPHLSNNLQKFLGDSAKVVLVPLCGKTKDMAYLAERGHAVIGVELAVQAAEQFFGEWGVEPEIRVLDGAPMYSAGGVTIIVGDIFEVSLPRPIDAIYDRAAIVALPPDVRVAYAERLLSWLPAGGNLLQVTFEYDQDEMSGPPFSVTDAELRRHYGEAMTMEQISSDDILARNEKFKARGLTRLLDRCLLLKKRASPSA